MTKNLSQNILATVCYYDCLDYPLTAFEVWKYMIGITNYELNEITDDAGSEKFSLKDVINELEANDLKKYIEEYRGFYFLKGRKNLVLERIKREKISAAKIKKLRRVVWLLRLVPFVRMIGVTGRLAMKNAENSSDWDILVVLKKGKIWTGRTLVTLLIHLIGKRRHDGKIKDRVCLNYFITDQSLEIITKDLFSSNEYSFMFPLYDPVRNVSRGLPRPGKNLKNLSGVVLCPIPVSNGVDTGGVFRKFQFQNRWIKNFRPNYQPEEIGNLRIIKDSWLSQTSRTLGEALFGFDFLEKWLRKWEKGKIMRNPKTREKGGLIIASDEKLIFLPEPQGPEVFEKFQEKLNKLTSDI